MLAEGELAGPLCEQSREGLKKWGEECKHYILTCQ